MTIYVDTAAQTKGLRTRYFRENSNGTVDWIYAVDYAAGSIRWYGFGMAKDSITSMRQRGYELSKLNPARYIQTDWTV